MKKLMQISVALVAFFMLFNEKANAQSDPFSFSYIANPLTFCAGTNQNIFVFTFENTDSFPKIPKSFKIWVVNPDNAICGVSLVDADHQYGPYYNYYSVSNGFPEILINFDDTVKSFDKKTYYVTIFSNLFESNLNPGFEVRALDFLYEDFGGIHISNLYMKMNGYVQSAPIANVLIKNQIFCQGGFAELTLYSKGLKNWSWSGTNQYHSNQNFFAYEPQRVYLYIEDVYGCSNNKWYEVQQIPSQKEPEIVRNGLVLSSSVSANSFVWYRNSIPLPNSNVKYFTVKEAGYYAVEAFNQYGCGTISHEIYYDFKTGIEDVEKNGIKVYPNPFTDILNVQSLEKGELNIFNLAGQIVFSQSVEEGSNTISISLPTGIYFAKIGDFVTKISKQ